MLKVSKVGIGKTLRCFWSGECYKFILIFKGRDCQNNINWSCCLYAALNYVIDVWECGHLDSCHIASCLCNNVNLNVHLGAKGSSGTNWKDSIRGSIPSVMNVNLVQK